MYKKLLFFIAQCIVLGTLVFYIVEAALNGIINERGDTIDNYNSYVCCMLIFAASYHAIVFMETWNYTGCMVFWYMWSVAQSFVSIEFADITPGFLYSHN